MSALDASSCSRRSCSWNAVASISSLHGEHHMSGAERAVTTHSLHCASAQDMLGSDHELAPVTRMPAATRCGRRRAPAGHEDEDVALDRLREVHAQRLLDRRAHVVLLRRLAVLDLDGERAAGDLEDGHAAKKGRKLIRVERRGGHDEAEVAPGA
jgi:hypothetical protein